MINPLQNNFTPGALSGASLSLSQPPSMTPFGMMSGLDTGATMLPGLDGSAMSWQTMRELGMQMPSFGGGLTGTGAVGSMMGMMQMMLMLTMMKELLEMLMTLLGKDKVASASGGAGDLQAAQASDGAGGSSAAGGAGATSAAAHKTGRLTPRELVDVLRQAGFSGEGLKIAWAIAMRESGGNPGAFNGNAGTGDKSYGLFQINMLGSMGPARLKQYGLSSNEALLDPLTNAKVAFQMSKGGTDFGAWGVGPNAYRRSADLDAALAKYLAQFPG